MEVISLKKTSRYKGDTIFSAKKHLEKRRNKVLTDLLDPSFDADYDIGNDDGIEFGDCYYLNYYGINVLFYVCGLDKHRVRIYELAKKKRIIDGVSAEYLTPELKPTRSPLVVLENNCWTKSNYWARTNNKRQIEIPVKVSDPLYKKAVELGIEYPATGLCYAIWLEEEQKKGVANFYWPAPKKNKKKVSNKCIN